VKHVFVVGCPRSGTSWLQLLLAQHPSVATTQETHLFNHYLYPLRHQWERLKSWPSALGMRLLFSDDEFYALCGDLTRKVFQRIADTNPGATMILEKTPEHVRHAGLILKLLPNAAFVHLVRDPRSVVSSLRAAAREWGTPWPSPSIRANAKLWVTSVTLGQQIAQLTPRYKEIRYEDLRSDNGTEVLADLMAWLEIPGGPEFAAQALQACRIDKLRDGGEGVRGYEALKRPETGFFRKGTADAWKEDLTSTELQVVEYIAGGLMRQLGYTPRTPDPITKPVRLAIAEFYDRADNRVRRRLDKWRPG
jgi:hypothetical protein